MPKKHFATQSSQYLTFSTITHFPHHIPTILTLNRQTVLQYRRKSLQDQFHSQKAIHILSEQAVLRTHSRIKKVKKGKKPLSRQFKFASIQQYLSLEVVLLRCSCSHLPKYACGTRLVCFNGCIITLGGYFCESFPEKGIGMQIKVENGYALLSSYSMKGTIPSTLINHEVTELNGRLYLFGGSKMFPKESNQSLFCYKDQQWLKMRLLSQLKSRRHFTIHSLSNYVLLVGGITDGNTFARELDIINIYNGLVFSQQLQTYAYHKSVLYSEKNEHYILAFGGMTSDQRIVARLRCIRLNLRSKVLCDSKGWQLLDTSGPSPSPRIQHTMQFIKNQEFVIVLGGRSKEGMVEDKVHVLNLSTCNWVIPRVEGELNRLQRFGHSMVVMENRVIVFGGYSKSLEYASGVLAINIQMNSF